MSRSHSRGREEYGSSGRGGAGNIRPQSRDPIHRGQPPDDFSPSRGRELRNPTDEHYINSGRGGAGNIRPPSRDPEGERRGYEADKKLVKDYDSNQHIHSSGRGGVGNIDRSRSRSRSRDAHNNKAHHPGVLGNLIGQISRGASRERTHPSTQHHTTGRGGYGNTYEGETPNANKGERVEEEQRNTYKTTVDDGGAHSSGRGGYGNTSSAVGAGAYDTQAPPNATSEHNTYATGRGGAGNIHGDS